MNDTTVNFRCDTAHFTLLYPKAIQDLSQANLKKLFKYMVTDRNNDANEDAIRITHSTLQDYVAETKAAWAKASADYQNGYVDIRSHYYQDCRDKKKAEMNNKKLLSTVKSAKAVHTRASKLLTYFEDIKAKCN